MRNSKDRIQFTYFKFFYTNLNWRMLLILGLSMVVGLLDGIGLALFIPLIQLVLSSEDSTDDGQENDFVSSLVMDHLGIRPELGNIFLLILLFFSLKALAKFFETYYRVVFQQYFMRKIRFEGIDLLRKLDYQSFARADAGRIQNTLSGEVTKINQAFKFYIKAFQYMVLVCVYFTIAIASEWRFTLIIILGGVLINLLFKTLYARTKYFSRKLTGQSHYYQNLLLQNVNLFKYLKATGLIDSFSQRLKKSISSLEHTQRRLGLVDAVLLAMREPLVIIVVFGAIFVYAQLFEELAGGILLSLLLIYRAITFFMASQENWNLFLGVSGSIQNLRAFYREFHFAGEKEGTCEFSGIRDGLELNEVGFSYENLPVLNGINLKIRKNESLAVVGPSGSGKTTLINIISGLLPPDTGTFTIDQVPVSSYSLRSYKKKIGYITQDPVIFNDTIFNNVSFWEEKTPEHLAKFEGALKKAAVYDFVMMLPEKEETLLGNNGINLSGGQKQRISIARELFKEVDILILDEATSSLDSETEKEIQQNINALKGQYTIISIAHRLSTIRGADRIILLKGGRMAAIGNYEELIRTSREFSKMLTLQQL